MAHTGIYATAAEMEQRAGTGAAAGAITEAQLNIFAAQAESTINVSSRLVFAADAGAFAALPATTKKILAETAADLSAIYIIIWDMSGYTSRVEAEDLINVLRDAALRNLSVLRDKKSQAFLLKGNIA